MTIWTHWEPLITKMLPSSVPPLPIHKRQKGSIRSQKTIEKIIQNHKKIWSKLKTAYETIQTNQFSTPIIGWSIQSLLLQSSLLICVNAMVGICLNCRLYFHCSQSLVFAKMQKTILNYSLNPKAPSFTDLFPPLPSCKIGKMYFL